MPGDMGPCRQLAQAIADTPPFSLLDTKPNLQFAMFGLEGAGKTTLLYKLKIPQWKRDDIKRDLMYLKKSETNNLGRDPSYHYEEMTAMSMRYGIWEVPGNDVMMRMWPMFYRYVRISAVLFVVDAYSDHWSEVDKVTSNRYWMNLLLNEDELRTAAFILILNVGDGDKPGRRENSTVLDHNHFASGAHRDPALCTPNEQAIYEMLGVPEIMKMEAHYERFFTFSCNCTLFSRNEAQWEKILTNIKTVYRTKGEGSFWGR